jgi:hypothetical protein
VLIVNAFKRKGSHIAMIQLERNFLIYVSHNMKYSQSPQGKTQPEKNTMSWRFCSVA